MINDDLRRQAKAINFGIIYGMSAYGLARELDISNKMAQTYIDHYFDRYKGVRAFIDKTILTAHDTRQTSTLLGRIRSCRTSPVPTAMCASLLNAPPSTPLSRGPLRT